MVFDEYALKNTQTTQFLGDQECPLIVSKLMKRGDAVWGKYRCGQIYQPWRTRMMFTQLSVWFSPLDGGSCLKICVCVYVRVYVCAYVCAHENRCLQRLEKSTRSSGTELTGHCNWSRQPWVLGTELWSTARVVPTLNHWTISLYPNVRSCINYQLLCNKPPYNLTV